MNALQDDGAPAPARTETGTSPNATGRERNADTGNPTASEHVFESPLAGALECVRRLDAHAFPLVASGDKKPAIKGWQTAAAKDEDQLSDWAEQFRGCNFGIATEASGLVVLDEDTPGDLDAWAESEGIDLPETFAVATGREGGGTHFWFHTAEVFKSSSPMKPKFDVDVKARGGLVVAPGSVHKSGAVYRVVNDAPIADLPYALAAHLRRPSETACEVEPPAEPLPDLVGRRYIDVALDGLRADLAEASTAPLETEPRWDPTVMRVAYRVVELSNLAPGVFTRADALRFLQEHAPTDSDFTATNVELKFIHAATELGYTGGREKAAEKAEDVFGDLGPLDGENGRGNGKRHLVVQRASEIQPRRVLWLWDGRMPVGALSLLAGREGLGKSSLMAWLIAQVTRGTLPGNLHGHPRAVIIAATEDSWEHTLVPRLMAAGADLHLVLRVDVMTSKGFTVDLSLPDDIPAVKELAEQEGVALMVLDPLMSRLHNLDTHKDAEVRIALEPLVRMADETGMALVGLIHLNKSSNDPLNAVMGSKAFTAVARSVSTVVPDDSDEEDRRRLFGTVKNNLGPALAASQVYTIDTAEVQTPDGPTPVGKLVWHGEVDTTIKAAMADTGMDSRTAVGEAQVWLYDVLSVETEPVARKDVMASAKKAGISESALKRAAKKLEVVSTEGSTFPRTTHWSLPQPFDTDAPGEDS